MLNFEKSILRHKIALSTFAHHPTIHFFNQPFDDPFDDCTVSQMPFKITNRIELKATVITQLNSTRATQLKKHNLTQPFQRVGEYPRP